MSFLKHDLKAGITVFFVALPLCLGVALASGTPVYSGLIAGIVGGLIVSIISKSELSVSGPAAGLTAICFNGIQEMGSLHLFFLSVSLAGVLQFTLGKLKLGEFTHFIPSAVIKGMLAAIGIILVSKQIPLLIGYDQPDFWTNELVNVFTFSHGFERVEGLLDRISPGAIFLVLLSGSILYVWKKYLAAKLPFIPASFITVTGGAALAALLPLLSANLRLDASLYVNVPADVLKQISIPDPGALFSGVLIWKYAVIIAVVASLETLLSVEAIDKIDPYNRITPQNRELMAQGTGNFISGLLGGIPITAVIVRSSANAEAGGRTRLSSITHGLWLLLVILFAVPLVNRIPYCVLAVILIRTGINLARPALFVSVYKQGREQFLPFIVTVVAILLSDLLIGVGIGLTFAIYFIIKHTYKAGFVMQERREGHYTHYVIETAMNVSFLNKKKFRDTLDAIPAYSVVEIVTPEQVYIDHDILEILHQYKAKARQRHIDLIMRGVPDVDTLMITGH
ncbi:MAG: SulP family inorganic anion transporter [Bacteroidia bacterium]|nr:SulP family inorganic anion transporter [Bacteroidia bacterium]